MNVKELTEKLEIVLGIKPSMKESFSFKASVQLLNQFQQNK